MADDDQDAARPSLEPPKLFGRRRRADDVPEPELDLPPDPGPALDEDATTVEPFSDPTWMFEPPDDEPEPAPEPPASVLPAEAGAPLFADEVEAAPPAPARTRGQRTAPEPRRPRTPRKPSLPTLSGWVAAAITGSVVGLLLVGMTAGSLQGCEAVRGTSTCGGWGLGLLILIMAILVALGGFLLRVFQVPDPGSTSFLALGMVAVITLLFLLDVLENWWMIIAIPVISAAMYLLGYWVTTAFVEPAKEPAEKG
ncbi:MAG: hypothetical protein M3237_16125 [Actinomycetota bacterium]|nr:hypothetical protein [Actinomycetota bacterium]